MLKLNNNDDVVYNSNSEEFYNAIISFEEQMKNKIKTILEYYSINQLTSLDVLLIKENGFDTFTLIKDYIKQVSKESNVTINRWLTSYNGSIENTISLDFGKDYTSVLMKNFQAFDKLNTTNGYDEFYNQGINIKSIDVALNNMKKDKDLTFRLFLNNDYYKITLEIEDLINENTNSNLENNIRDIN